MRVRFQAFKVSHDEALWKNMQTTYKQNVENKRRNPNKLQSLINRTFISIEESLSKHMNQSFALLANSHTHPPPPPLTNEKITC
jgi:hypothetical protein